MDESFVLKIRKNAASQPRGIPFPPASQKDVEEAEACLGFPIPKLLKSIFLEVGNGGFGPGRGGSIIGLKGGYASDFGTIVETYKQLNEYQESEGKAWKVGLLPFCEWGCNLFSCVDCNDPHFVYLFEDFDVHPKYYSLSDFFKLWTDGVDIFSYEGTGTEAVEVINPFTGQKTHVMRRQRE
jgi:hypothetical protein